MYEPIKNGDTQKKIRLQLNQTKPKGEEGTRWLKWLPSNRRRF
jgi:hypothetical protein